MPPEQGNNQEIANALAEFEAKAAPDLVPQNPDAGEVIQIPIVPETPKMVTRVIKWSGGLIKNEEQANYVLLAAAVVFFALSLFFFFK